MRWNLGRLDDVLQTALLLRLSEEVCARDRHYEIIKRVDVDGAKLDAFSFGVVDVLTRTHLVKVDVLPIVLYLMKLDEHGPGRKAVDLANRAATVANDPGFAHYVNLGRSTALRTLASGAPSPGGYAELLLEESTSASGPVR